MRNINKYLGLLFVGALSLSAVSCQDDFDDPAMTTPESAWLADADNYQLMTIEQIKEMFWSDDTNYYYVNPDGEPYIPAAPDGRHYLIKARVISSDASGNVYKSLYIQDETGALTMSINANSMNNKFRRGQELVLDLTGMTIGKYAGLQQLGFPEDSPQYGRQTTFMPYQFFLEHEQMNGQPNLAEVDTIVINDFSQLSGGPEVIRKWQSQLVRFNNCSFQNGGQATFAESKVTKSQTLNVQGGSIDVRTSGYSNFYAQTLPEGNGDVVGLLGYFNNAYQLTLIDIAGCMNFGNPTIGPGGEENPYTVDQAVSVISSGGSVKNVWTTGYIVGAVAAGVQTVSSNSDIEFASNPDLPNTLVIATDPECKDWTKCMVIELPQGSALRQYGNLVDNPANYKKQLWILGNLGTYLGTSAITGNKGSVGTFRIDGVDLPDAPVPPTPANGDGSKEKPYSVSQVIALNPTSTTVAPSGGESVYVSGYIVGSMPTGGSSTTLSGTNFNTNDAATTNMVIAPSVDCKDYNECIGIQLPSGAIRSALNLKDNPGNLGKFVVIKGDVMKYCGGPGVKNVKEYTLEGGDAPAPSVDPVTSIDENFNSLSSLPSGWSQAQISGSKTWYITSFNSIYYAAMTGYKGTAPFDSWMFTPPVDMDKVTEKTLSFETQVNGYNSTTTEFEVYVLTSNDPATANKTKLNPTLAVAPASGYSSWVKSGEIDLSAFSGVVYIGFRYAATSDANYATWCVTNVKLNAGGGNTPVQPETPAGGSGSESDPYNVAQIVAMNPTSTTQSPENGSGVYVKGYIVGSMPASGTTINKTNFGLTDASTTNLVLGPSADCTDYTKCIAIQLPKGAVRSALNLSDNPGNLGKQVLLKGDVMKYCSGPGLKNTSSYSFIE